MLIYNETTNGTKAYNMWNINTMTIRVRPLHPSFSRMCHQLILFLLLTILSTCHSSETYYTDHCNTIVPQSTPSGISLESYSSFPLSNGYFSGGNIFLGPDSNHSTSSSNGTFVFSVSNLQHTRTLGIIYAEGTLTLESSEVRFFPYNTTKSRFPYVNPHDLQKPHMYCRRMAVRFELSGFWSQYTGKICMVGNGYPLSEQGTFPELTAVLRLNYPTVSNISTSLFTGRIESLDSIGGKTHFDPISIIAYYQYNYNFTMIPKTRDSCSHTSVLDDPLRVEFNQTCSFIQTFLGRKFRLKYGSDCRDKNCSLFSGMSLEFFPSYLSLRQIQCAENGRVNMYITFSEVGYYEHNSFLVPGKSLVGEGFWDPENNQLCIVSCPILENTSIGNCTIGLSLWFAAVFSIKNRSSAVGQIWSDKDMKNPGIFRMNLLHTAQNNPDILPGLRYKYTTTDDVRKTCIIDKSRMLDNKIYPNWTAHSGDMRFDLSLKQKGRDIGRGYAIPLSFGENIYGNPYAMPLDAETEIWNVSYMISYTIFSSSSGKKETREVSAEGIYDSGSGMLCMVGCQYAEHVKTEDGVDCEILINIHFSPLNSETGKYVNGTIKSRRKNTDPLYFEPLEVFSSNLYSKQAREMLNRMNAETVMFLALLTISLFFIGSQLFHARKHPDALPSMSITMLVVLTLEHLVPFWLNMQSLFFAEHNILLWSGGWIEAKEIMMSTATIAALVLIFRLLQSAWIARSAHYSKKALWLAEWKALGLYVGLYLLGALVAWFVPMRSTETEPGRIDFFAEHQVSLWGTLIRYAGWMLDGFLLPQIIVNTFVKFKGKALSLPFYAGITVVHAAPRLYDAYRARYYIPFLKMYIYARPDGDSYPRVSNFVIPLGGAILAAVLYFQQQLGGCFFLPRASRETDRCENNSCC